LIVLLYFVHTAVCKLRKAHFAEKFIHSFYPTRVCMNCYEGRQANSTTTGSVTYTSEYSFIV
ncbi:MAG TPA: hypothetical protein VEP90_09980, partial [Methylomirabilota bacterium]|nr:hypothetical protein [Methylomirabilota bacterium]